MKLTKQDKAFLDMAFWEADHSSFICNLEPEYMKSCKKLYPESVTKDNKCDFNKLDPKKYVDEYIVHLKDRVAKVDDLLCGIQRELFKLSEL